MITHPIPDDAVPELKAKALRITNREPRFVEIGDEGTGRVCPYEVCVRAATLPEYKEYFNGASDAETATTTNFNLMDKCVLAPRDVIPRPGPRPPQWVLRAEVAKGFTLLPNRIADVVEQMAGGAKPEVHAITPETDPVRLAELGLDEATAQRLLATYPDGKLRALVVPLTPSDWRDDDQERLVYVVQALDETTTAELSKGVKGRDKYQALYDLVVAAHVWNSLDRPVNALLAEYPGLASWELFTLLVDSAGGMARVRAKKR